MKRLVFASVLGTLITGLTLVSSHSEAQADCSPDSYYGSICITAGNWCPRDYITLYGYQELPIAQYTELYAVISNYYGGNGQTTVGLPHTQGRILIGDGAGPGLTPYYLGDYTGLDYHTMLDYNLPPHTHATTLTVKEDVPLAFIATADSGTETSPTADGKSFKAVTTRNSAAQPSFIDHGNTKDLVNLGGASTTTTQDVQFTLRATGVESPQIPVVQPQLGLRYCVMAEYGDWPPRP